METVKTKSSKENRDRCEARSISILSIQLCWHLMQNTQLFLVVSEFFDPTIPTEKLRLIKSFIYDLRQARSINADLLSNFPCTEDDNIKALGDGTATCRTISYATLSPDSRRCDPPENFCCESLVTCGTDDGDLKHNFNIDSISEPEYEACRRELNLIAHFLGLECTPPE